MFIHMPAQSPVQKRKNRIYPHLHHSMLRFLMRMVAMTLLVLIMPALAGCSKPPVEPLTKDNLAGKRIGVMNSFSPDYVVSKLGKDLKLYRYDSYGDMSIAVKFGRLDAAALESDEADVFIRMEPSFQIGLTFAEGDESGYQFSAKKTELIKEFNDFLRDFRKSEAYKDILVRVSKLQEAPYVPNKVENVPTTDRVLKVLLFDGWEPVSYKNTATDEWEGSDVELITHFANHIGAKLELTDASWSQMLIELGNGMKDLAIMPQTLLTNTDLEMSGRIKVTDAVWEKDIVLVINKEAE